MRTTITIDDGAWQLLQDYHLGSGAKRTTSEIISTALQIALPILAEELPLNEESLEDTLLRRAAMLRQRVCKASTEKGKAAYLSQALSLQNDCLQLLNGSGVEVYRRCSLAALNAWVDDRPDEQPDHDEQI